LLVLAYSLGVVGIFLQMAGAHWDVSWHLLGIVETFFTPPHAVLYAGIGLAILGASLGLWMVLGKYPIDRPLLTGLKLAVVGGVFQLVSGPLDLWWHETHGFDPYLFTPTHSILIVGVAIQGVGITVGTVRLFQARETIFLSFLPPRLLQTLVIFSLATLWLGMNFVLNWLFNAEGIAYTFNICSPAVIASRHCDFVQAFYRAIFLPALFLFSATGTLVLFGAKKVIGWRGAVTLVALLATLVQAATDFAFPAFLLLNTTVPGSFYATIWDASFGREFLSVIPFYLALLAPVLVFDVLVKDGARLTALLASALLGPVSMYMEARFSFFSGLWTIELQSSALFLAVMIAGGFFAGLLRERFADVLR